MGCLLQFGDSKLQRWTRKVGISAILLALSFALGLADIAQAQTDEWSAPLQLSQPGSAAWFPSTVFDAMGTAYVVWSSADREFDTVFLTTQAPALPFEAGIWSEPVDVLAYPTNAVATRPVATINNQGRLYVGVHGPGDKLYVATAPAQDISDPTGWNSGMPVSSGYHILPTFAGDILHVLYTQGVSSESCEQCLHLYHMQSADSGESWSDPVDISRRLDRGAAKPQFLIGSTGAFHVVWESGLDGDRGYVTGPVRVHYAASYDGGATWTTPYQLDAIPADQPRAETFARNVAIGQAGDGTLITVWWNMPEDQPFFRTSNDEGRTWSNIGSLPSVWGVGDLSTTQQDTYSMVTDSGGVVHLLMMGRTGQADETISLLHLQWDGSGWSPPEVVATYDMDLPEWPQAAIGLGNQLRAVWHVRPGYLESETNRAPPEVWEAHATLLAPAVEAVAAPAVVAESPGTSGTVDATAAPTLLPTPAFDRAAPASIASIRTLMTENDDVLIMALSLLPAAALVVAGLLWRRRRL